MLALTNPRNARLAVAAAVVTLIVSLALSVFSVATVLSAPLQATVSVPSLVGFEGFLADSAGNPVADGNYSVTFAVYSVSSGGTALWSETHASVPVTKGLYAVTLGSITAITQTTFDGNRWIGVTVGSGTEMTPRTRVSSVPFALNADSANKVGGTSLAGMIALFDSGCPSGWTEVTSTRGRVVLGVPAGGTVSGTVGTALGNLVTRTITDVVAHTHGAGTLTIDSAGSHSHTISLAVECCGTNIGGLYVEYVSPGYTPTNSTNTGSAGAHTHTISGSTASAGISAVDVTMPYVQLTYCKLS